MQRYLNLCRCSILTLVAACGGCMDPVYFLHVAGGELRSLNRAQPIKKVIEEGKVTEDQKEKLLLVLQVREYAKDKIGLNVASAYTTYEDIEGAPIAYAVSGVRKDKLEPYEWTYPIIGKYEAKGFFKKELAEQEAKRLQDKCYDTTISEVAGFSTMGILPDPVRSSNLLDDKIGLADLIFHETTHNTIFKPSDTQFNESMATFIGRTAAVEYFQKTYGEGSQQALAAERRVADLRVIDEYVSDIFDELTTLYAQPISSEEKISRREEVFARYRQSYTEKYAPRLNEPQRFEGIVAITADNATVLAAYRYFSRLDTYEQAYAETGRNLCSMIRLLERAARHKDSMAYLQEWTVRRRPVHAAPGVN